MTIKQEKKKKVITLMKNKIRYYLNCKLHISHESMLIYYYFLINVLQSFLL